MRRGRDGRLGQLQFPDVALIQRHARRECPLLQACRKSSVGQDRSQLQAGGHGIDQAAAADPPGRPAAQHPAVMSRPRRPPRLRSRRSWPACPCGCAPLRRRARLPLKRTAFSRGCRGRSHRWCPGRSAPPVPLLSCMPEAMIPARMSLPTKPPRQGRNRTGGPPGIFQPRDPGSRISSPSLCRFKGVVRQGRDVDAAEQVMHHGIADDHDIPDSRGRRRRRHQSQDQIVDAAANELLEPCAARPGRGRTGCGSSRRRRRPLED